MPNPVALLCCCRRLFRLIIWDWEETKMGRIDYQAMKTDPVVEDSINSDVNDFKAAAKMLIKDATKLGGLPLGTSSLKWVASFAAM